MAGASLIALLDDIASILDDVAAMSKVAAKKTAGVLGDDLALNAQQVGGVHAERELPVVWAVARGSLRNKAILVPAALGISAFAPWAVAALLMLGGFYLCYEGVEKLVHKWLHSADEDAAHHAEHLAHVADEAVEAEKIQGAIRTDFVLSAEIIVIALGTVAEEQFLSQVVVLSIIALVMTVGVYGIVAAIVKMDDAGLYLLQRGRKGTRGIGRLLLVAAPALMRLLAVAGTVAMFMVGGGIIMHGITPLHHAVEHASEALELNHLLASLLSLAANVVVGIVGGFVALAAVKVFTMASRLLPRKAS